MVEAAGGRGGDPHIQHRRVVNQRDLGGYTALAEFMALAGAAIGVGAVLWNGWAGWCPLLGAALLGYLGGWVASFFVVLGMLAVAHYLERP